MSQVSCALLQRPCLSCLHDAVSSGDLVCHVVLEDILHGADGLCSTKLLAACYSAHLFAVLQDFGFNNQALKLHKWKLSAIGCGLCCQGSNLQLPETLALEHDEALLA